MVIEFGFFFVTQRKFEIYTVAVAERNSNNRVHDMHKPYWTCYLSAAHLSRFDTYTLTWLFQCYRTFKQRLRGTSVLNISPLRADALVVGRGRRPCRGLEFDEGRAVILIREC